MAKKRKAARSSRGSRKPTSRRRRVSDDTTVNTLVILVVIVIVLAGLYLYAQNKKQASLLQGLPPAIAAVIGPVNAALSPRTVAVSPATQPTRSAEIRTPEPAAGNDGRQPITLIETR
ncbi:MAG TPA: hypothetical protein VFB29_03840 [Pseudolabrys sp.]|nr:hypothetical protein [Pseudolabrys sp.]